MAVLFLLAPPHQLLVDARVRLTSCQRFFLAQPSTALFCTGASPCHMMVASPFQLVAAPFQLVALPSWARVLIIAVLLILAPQKGLMQLASHVAPLLGAPPIFSEAKPTPSLVG